MPTPSLQSARIISMALSILITVLTLQLFTRQVSPTLSLCSTAHYR